MSGDDNRCPPARLLEPWELPGAENPLETMERDLRSIGEQLEALERELMPQPIAPQTYVAGELRTALESLDVNARLRFLVAEGERAAPPEARELVAIARRYCDGAATRAELDPAEQRAWHLMAQASEAFDASSSADDEARKHAMKVVWIVTVGAGLGEDALDMIASGLAHVAGVLERARAWR